MTTTVLITGTSSGIGYATALHLARRPGLTVYATARRPETLTDLTRAGARALALDVTVVAAIERAATARRPRTRYVVTPAAKALVHTRRLFGARVFDAYLRSQFKAAGPATAGESTLATERH